MTLDWERSRKDWPSFYDQLPVSCQPSIKLGYQIPGEGPEGNYELVKTLPLIWQVDQPTFMVCSVRSCSCNKKDNPPKARMARWRW